MCCGNSPDGTNACNRQEPGKLALGDDNECSSNSRIKEYYQSLYECEHGDRGVSKTFMKEIYCDIDLFDCGDNCKSRVCDIIKSRWRWDA